MQMSSGHVFCHYNIKRLGLRRLAVSNGAGKYVHSRDYCWVCIELSVYIYMYNMMLYRGY